MKVVDTTYVNHEGKHIFSCDIHPDGVRFATGGQGTSSGRIAIWNLVPVLNKSIEDDENVPKCLCLLDNHASCVNSVRWSSCGKNLASGGDDKLIMIWALSAAAKVNGSGVPMGLDQWRCVHTLTGHESDVLDVAWGPNDTRLASCSVDNSVIVWTMEGGKPSMLTKLLGHSGLVKGVVWDPVGEYLASQSDDRTLKIWRTSDWKQHVSIEQPFKQCGDLTHVLRLDWSPDGLYVVSANACNSGGPTAQIIERAMDDEKKCWPTELDYVGHRKAVTCVKFNSSLMSKSPGDIKYSLVATGSRDCSIAIWSTNRRRPFMAMKNCFSRSVVDLSWGLQGRLLAACSWDGSVLFFHFEPGELGRAVGSDEKLAAMESIYGKTLMHGKVEPIVEMPQLLPQHNQTVEPMEQEKEKEKKEGEDKQQQQLQQQQQQKQVVNEEPGEQLIQPKQIEMKRPDGRRRITPIALPKDAPLPNVMGFSSSSNVKTKIVVEKVVAVKTSPPLPPTTPQIRPKRSSLVHSEPVVVAHSSSAPRLETRPPPARHLLRPLVSETDISIPVTGCDDLIVVNNCKEPLLARVRRESCSAKTPLWHTVLAHCVVGGRSNATFTVLLCSDRTINVLDSGCGVPQRLALILPGQPSSIDLTADKQLLCVVTTCGYVLLWDLLNNQQILRDSTLKEQLLSDPTAFALCKLADNGLPVIMLTNGRSFCYSDKMGWQLFTDVKSTLWQMANQQNELAIAGSSRMPFKNLIKEVKSVSSVHARGATCNLQPAITTALCYTTWLYQNLLASQVLASQCELKASLIALIKHLAHQGATPQLRHLLTTYAAPRGFLPECLQIIKGFLNCQRLYVEMTSNHCITDDSLGASGIEN